MSPCNVIIWLVFVLGCKQIAVYRRLLGQFSDAIDRGDVECAFGMAEIIVSSIVSEFERCDSVKRCDDLNIKLNLLYKCKEVAVGVNNASESFDRDAAKCFYKILDKAVVLCSEFLFEEYIRKNTRLVGLYVSRAYLFVSIVVAFLVLGFLSRNVVVHNFRHELLVYRVNRAASDLEDIKNFVRKAISSEKSTISQITLNGCSDCPCRGFDLISININDTCRRQWHKAILSILRESGETNPFNVAYKYYSDPWGSPYLLDEGAWLLRSAGPDGKFDTEDDMKIQLR